MKSLYFSKRLFPAGKTILIPLIAIAVLIGGCTGQNSQGPDTLPSDQEITQAIQSQLSESRSVDSENITVKTSDGIVTLSGSVSNLLAKTSAERISKNIRGVLSVVNNIKITASRPDDAIENDVNRALATDPATEEWQITVTVNNGLVTLKGAVDSWQEKQLAARIARGVKGVKEIANSTIVNYGSTRTDQEIKVEVQRGLMLDSRLRGDMIYVDVQDGNVNLRGAVGSSREKTLVKKLAHVTGVNTVNTDSLEVHPEYESSMFMNSAIDNLSEAEIMKAVQRALRYDPRVPADSVTVNVDGNTVILGGTVEYLNSKLAAGRDAKNTAGVNAVQNNITVQQKVVVSPEIPTTDEAVRERVREAIVRDPYVNTRQITINVNKGVVELKGEVENSFKKQQIEELTGKVKGVIGVDNELSIRGNS